MARIAPVSASITTTAPALARNGRFTESTWLRARSIPSLSASSTERCSSISSVRCTSAPGCEGSEPSARITSPSAFTMNFCTPFVPRSQRS